jgi:outer membrane protein TolC
MPLRRLRAAPWPAALAFAASSLAAASADAENLSAEQAVSRAAARNPTLRAALLDQTAARQAVAAEKGARQPVFTASIQAGYEERGNFGTIRDDAGAVVQRADDIDDTKSVSGKAAISYTTDVGTYLEGGIEAGNSWGSNVTADRIVTGPDPDGNGPLAAPSTQVFNRHTIQPSYDARAYLTVRQPLLRGAGKDAALAPLVQAEASSRAADKQRDLTASQTALDVLSAYWELWYAERAVLVQEQALASAQKQLDDAKARANVVGTGSQVDVLQFATNHAAIADSLSQARATRQTRALDLGRVLGLAPAQAATLTAAGEPPGAGTVPTARAVTDAIQARSLELEQLRAELVAQRSRVAAAEDADQVKLDVFATASAGAQWFDDSYIGLDVPGSRPVFSVVGGLELELPFGGGRQKADAARARTQLAAAEARYQARVDAIQAEASTLRVNLEASLEQIRLATETSRISSQLAEAEQQRLQIGTTTSSDVVKAEQTAREAELRRLRAVVSQISSQLQLQHATGVLLDKYAAVLGGRSS